MPINDHSAALLSAVASGDLEAVKQKILELRKTYRISKSLGKEAAYDKDTNYLHGFLNHHYHAALEKGDIKICLLFAANGASLQDKDLEELVSFTDLQVDALELREQLYIEQNFERSSHRVVVPGEMAHYRTELVGDEMKQVEIKSAPTTDQSPAHVKRWNAMANRIAEIRDTGLSEIKIPEVAPTKVEGAKVTRFLPPAQQGHLPTH